MNPLKISIVVLVASLGCTTPRSSDQAPRRAAVTPASQPVPAPTPSEPVPTDGELAPTADSVRAGAQSAIGRWSGARQIVGSSGWGAFATSPSGSSSQSGGNAEFVVVQMSGRIDPASTAPDSLRVLLGEGAFLLNDDHTLMLGAQHVGGVQLNEAIIGVPAGTALFVSAVSAPTTADQQCLTRAAAGQCSEPCTTALDRLRRVAWTIRLPPERIRTFRAEGPNVTLNFAVFMRPQRSAVRDYCGHRVSFPVADIVAVRVFVNSLGTTWEFLQPTIT